jgi:hypothetical protein
VPFPAIFVCRVFTSAMTIVARRLTTRSIARGGRVALEDAIAPQVIEPRGAALTASRDRAAS